MRDLNLPGSERGVRFSRWVSYYFTPIQDVNLITEKSLADRKPLHELPDNDKLGMDVTPTADRMSDELKAIVDLEAFEMSLSCLRHLARGDIYKNNSNKALFDIERALPSVDALLIWCDMSIPDCMMATKHLVDLHGVPSVDGRIPRKLDIVRLHTNHFVSHCPSFPVITLTRPCRPIGTTPRHSCNC